MAISLTDAGIVYTGTQSPAQASGTGGAYTLDDYEEGTWTAGVAGATPASPNNIGNTTGYYTKIGRQVTYQWYSSACNWASSSGAATITGLPFTLSADVNSWGVFNFTHGTGVDGSTTGGHINLNATTMTFIDPAATAGASFINSGGNFYMTVSGEYWVA